MAKQGNRNKPQNISPSGHTKSTAISSSGNTTTINKTVVKKPQKVITTIPGDVIEETRKTVERQKNVETKKNIKRDNPQPIKAEPVICPPPIKAQTEKKKTTLIEWVKKLFKRS